MISSWLIKVVLGIVLAGGIILELGSPLIAKAQADDAATQIADEVALKFDAARTSTDALEAACDEEAAKHSVAIVVCDYDVEKDEIVVRVRKEARSLILKNWSATEDWYEPEVTARSKPR